MKLIIDRVTIENDPIDYSDTGYCYISRQTEGNGSWLEIHGNEEKSDYPLCFESHEEIDTFCEKLHILLDGKLLPTGFIK